MAFNQYQSSKSFFLPLFFWLFVICFLSLSGLFLMDFLGIYPIKQYFSSYLGFLTDSNSLKYVSHDDPLLLEKERVGKRELSVKLYKQELVRREVTLAQRQLELEQLSNELTEQRKKQAEREDQFLKQSRRYEDENFNLRQNAQYLLEMSPQNAVARLQTMEDPILIANLRMAETIAQETNQNSSVAVWLSLLPADQASRILKKMQIPNN